MRSMPSMSLSKRTQQLERTLQPPTFQRRGLDLFVFVTPGLFLDWVGVRRRLQCLACFFNELLALPPPPVGQDICVDWVCV